MRELDQLYGELGMEDGAPNDTAHYVCNPDLPEAGEIWGDVVENVDQWWDALVETV